MPFDETIPDDVQLLRDENKRLRTQIVNLRAGLDALDADNLRLARVVADLENRHARAQEMIRDYQDRTRRWPNGTWRHSSYNTDHLCDCTVGRSELMRTAITTPD